VILLTRLGGAVFALNQDLIERADCTPDTVVTLIDGTKYVVAESLPDLADLVREFRAAVIAQAQELDRSGSPSQHRLPDPNQGPDREAVSTVVPLHRGGR
jgi:flagellar protein FlbD